MTAKKAKVEMTGELPSEVAALAQKTVDQAEAAFDQASDLAHSNVQYFDAAAIAYRGRFADIQMKMVEFTQNAVTASFAHTRSLFAVKGPAEFFALQQDFLRQQAETFQRQATEIGQLALQLAKETAKPVQDGVAKTFSDFSRTFAA
ncbi:MAG: phasin family protein [Hyphomicrobiales bacterium]